MNSDFLSDLDWRKLLREIHNRQVVPVVGPELATVRDPATGEDVALTRALAPRLAAALNLSVNDNTTTINRVACEHILSGGLPRDIYPEVADLLRGPFDELPSALCEIASITDFDLYLSGTIDPLLACALERQRPGFRQQSHVLAYDYRRPVDLPERIDGALVYHLVGSRETFPNFAVWDEDYLEFLFGLVSHHAQLKRLFRTLKSRYLLFLGTPFEDWVVRFFLFVVRGQRFSEGRRDDVKACITDHPENLSDPLVFFFDRVVGTLRIIKGDPRTFASELTRRWKAEYGGGVADDDVLAQMPDEIPRDAVFVSYANEDLGAVVRLVRGLRAAGVPVWVDKQRLKSGTDYERALQAAVRVQCSYFVSLISRNSESDPARFVHQERRWAAQGHVDGYVYYVPVVIDDTPRPALEPPEFSRIHFERLPGGEITSAFASRMKRLVDEFRVSGRPRE